MPKEKLVGFIQFQDGIECRAEALSEAYEIELAGRNGLVFFPSLPEIDLHLTDPPFGGVALVQPRNWQESIKLNEGYEWGRIRSYPSGNSVVNLAIVKFENVENNKGNLGREFQDSFNIFMPAIKRNMHLACPSYSAVWFKGGDIYGLDLKIETLTNKECLNNSQYGGTITIDVSGNNYFSKEQLGKLFRLASYSKRIKLEYNLLVDACVACDSGDYRKTVIEVASAIEIGLTARIRNYFETNQITFGEKLLKKYRMLGGLIELCNVLNIEIPVQNINKIKGERNNILHKGEFPNQEIAKETLNIARGVINEISPNYFDD